MKKQPKKTITLRVRPRAYRATASSARAPVAQKKAQGSRNNKPLTIIEHAKQLGLIGCLTGSGITSQNYKQYLYGNLSEIENNCE